MIVLDLDCPRWQGAEGILVDGRIQAPTGKINRIDAHAVSRVSADITASLRVEVVLKLISCRLLPMIV
ncbi:MAG: hypothetical protein WC247_10695 [Porticoccaceae bacterium]